MCVCVYAGVGTAAAFHDDIMDKDQRQEVRTMIRFWNSKARLRLTFRHIMRMGLQYARTAKTFERTVLLLKFFMCFQMWIINHN